METCKSCENSTTCTECLGDSLLPPLCKGKKEGKFTKIIETPNG